MSLQKIYNQIAKNISAEIASFGVTVSPEEITLEKPANPEFGDISSNIALKTFKDAKNIHGEKFKSPKEYSEVLKEALSLSKVLVPDNIAGPGFLNYKIPETTLRENLAEIIAAHGDVVRESLQGKRIITEFTDPNPFKEFHIGHLYSNTVGESISRLYESIGAKVRRVCYQGDVGIHVAKSVWGMKKKLEEAAIDINDIESQTLVQKAKFLGEAYALGAQAYEEQDDIKVQIQALNKQIFAKDASIIEMYEKGRVWSMEYFETIYKRLGTKFEQYYFESEVGKQGLAVVKKYLSEGVFEESQGAVIFPGSRYGLHDRVFINSFGLPTYEAKELGLAPAKYRDWPYDQSIIITGNEIKEYFKVLLEALSLIEPELAIKTVHMSHGMLKLPEGKMSSRKGNILTGAWLIDEAKRLILKILVVNRSEWEAGRQEEVAEVLAIGAIKYALLKNNIGGDIHFTFEESISFEGNSGPYLQYTYARCKSVLRKSEIEDFSVSLNVEEMEPEERALLRVLIHFDLIVQEAAKECAPHHLCTYLFELSQVYNGFYNKHQILHADQDIQKFRLHLTKATALIIQKGLEILGIKTIEEM